MDGASLIPYITNIEFD